mmetsp:Transcript_14603/g.55177  ORF Transcript_14603/g.55177 Transcript_14603/m.55177 type:complete len:244 (+) Transcript_14603:509-1240(+)|eukprot:scaffold7352_cov254-Pinguiococcus_pyrenoidosus.AAC.17
MVLTTASFVLSEKDSAESSLAGQAGCATTAMRYSTTSSSTPSSFGPSTSIALHTVTVISCHVRSSERKTAPCITCKPFVATSSALLFGSKSSSSASGENACFKNSRRRCSAGGVSAESSSSSLDRTSSQWTLPTNISVELRFTEPSCLRRSVIAEVARTRSIRTMSSARDMGGGPWEPSGLESELEVDSGWDGLVGTSHLLGRGGLLRCSGGRAFVLLSLLDWSRASRRNRGGWLVTKFRERV